MSETNDASIVILSADLSAKQLIDAVGIEPDKKWNRNDPITEAGKGRYPKSGLRYNSLLDPERSVADHLHSVALRLEPARRPLLSLKRSFQSREGDGSIQLSIFTYRPTESIEFLLNVEDMAIFADVCTSLRVSVVGDPDRITGQ